MTTDMSLSVAVDMRHIVSRLGQGLDDRGIRGSNTGGGNIFVFWGGSFRSAVGTGRCFFGSKAAEV
jgi:hypothetical protein